jgi:hypothetical protein
MKGYLEHVKVEAEAHEHRQFFDMDRELHKEDRKEAVMGTMIK